MALGILVLITALTISAVAIYYSVAGLVAIFAAAALPIMIMGGALEVGKLVTAVWLHKYWSQAKWWLRTYLALAVLILMFITSMGIFGFLSKAHIEQTSAGEESVAQVERLTLEIDRQTNIIKRAEEQITKLETSGTGNDANIQSQIDKEQVRIDTAYDRIDPAIAEQNTIIAGVTALFQQELDRIDGELATLQGYIDAGEIKKAQGMVGTATDGAYGPKTAAAFTAWQDAKRAERNEWLQKIQESANSPTVKAARDEIARLRKSAEDQIAQSNTLINRLRNQLGTTDKTAEIDAQVDEQNARIKTANAEINTLTEEKYALEGEYRKLEAEVGPIKYIAEFVYGENADNNMLEDAVRWVIIIIIFVFDPLAVLLLIASQYTFEFRRKQLEDDSGDRLRLERQEYEQARAQRIVDNPGYNIDDLKEDADENDQREDREETEQVDTSLPKAQPSETVEAQDEADPVVATEKERKLNVTTNTTTTDDDSRDVLSKDDIAKSYHTDDRVEQSKVQADEIKHQEYLEEEKTSNPIEKKELESSEESNDLENWNKWVEAAEEAVQKEEVDIRAQKVTEQETDAEWVEAKRKWKDENPDQNLKDWKHAYISGRIEDLPWAKYVKNSYVQNEEQSENSIWNKLSRADNK